MAKYQFIKETHFGSHDWHYTRKDGDYVSDSGHSDYQKALDKYNYIIGHGQLKTTEVLLSTEIKEDKDND
jgi:hypothetical protein